MCVIFKSILFNAYLHSYHLHEQLNAAKTIKPSFLNYNLHPVIIPTERLLLKGISPHLIHTIFTTDQEADIKAFFGIDDKGYATYKDMHEKGMETYRHSLFYFLVVDKETNSPIGECGFHTWNLTHRRAELFYLLRNDTHKRKGYMTEVVPHVIRYGFEHMELVRIEALLAKWNTPSVRLLQQNRFTFEGTMRQHYSVNGINEDSDCYSLLKAEWETHVLSSS